MFGKKERVTNTSRAIADGFEDNGLALVEIKDDKVINGIIMPVPQLVQA